MSQLSSSGKKISRCCSDSHGAGNGQDRRLVGGKMAAAAGAGAHRGMAMAASPGSNGHGQGRRHGGQPLRPEWGIVPGRRQEEEHGRTKDGEEETGAAMAGFTRGGRRRGTRAGHVRPRLATERHRAGRTRPRRGGPGRRWGLRLGGEPPGEGVREAGRPWPHLAGEGRRWGQPRLRRGGAPPGGGAPTAVGGRVCGWEGRGRGECDEKRKGRRKK